jgi:hypothetical protein
MEEFGSHHNPERKNERSIYKYPGLKESLDLSTDWQTRPNLRRYKLDEIVNVMATDARARKAVVDYLHREPSDPGAVLARGMLEEIAWALVDELATRLGQKGR